MFHLIGVLVLQKSPNQCCYVYLLRQNQDPAPRLYYYFLTAHPPLLVSVSSLFSDYLLLEPALWNSEKVVEAEDYFLQINRRNGKASMPRSPTGSCSVSPGLVLFSI